MIEYLIALVLVIMGVSSKNPTYFVAAGLFAIAGGIDTMNDRKEDKGC